MKEEILIEKSKYSEAQIVATLKQAENGVPVSGLLRSVAECCGVFDVSLLNATLVT